MFFGAVQEDTNLVQPARAIVEKLDLPLFLCFAWNTGIPMFQA
jgi:predicted nicotinamide N-methyase